MPTQKKLIMIKKTILLFFSLFILFPNSSFSQQIRFKTNQINISNEQLTSSLYTEGYKLKHEKATTFIDLDNDGFLDLVLLLINDKNDLLIKTYLNNGKVSFNPLQEIKDKNPNKLVDLNGDHFPDLLSGEFIYFNKNGTFDSIGVALPSLYYRKIFLDINQDAYLDLIHHFNGSFILNTNKGNGEFQQDTLVIKTNRKLLGDFIAVDIDNDGDQDIYCTSYIYKKHLYIPLIFKNENGHFIEQENIQLETHQNSHSFFEDLDYDNDLDLVTVFNDRYKSDKIEVYLNNSLGDYSKASFIDLNNASRLIPIFIDYNKDGYKDMIFQWQEIKEGKPSTKKLPYYWCSLYLGDSLGGYKKSENNEIEITKSSYSFNLYITDINNDTNIDFFKTSFTASYGNRLQISLNNGNNSFSTTTLTPHSLDANILDIIDLNNDGLNDLFIQEASNNLNKKIGTEKILVHNGESFNTVLTTNDTLNEIILIDVNNDGYKDIFNKSYLGEQRLYVYNQSNNTFEEKKHNISNLLEDNNYEVTDINSDGFLDFLIFGSQYNSPSKEFSLYLNNGDGSFHLDEKSILNEHKAHYGTSTFCDFDYDGDQDIILRYATLVPDFNSYKSYFWHIKTYKNNGSGFFTETTKPAWTGLGQGEITNSYNGSIIFSYALNKPRLFQSSDSTGLFQEVKKLPYSKKKRIHFQLIDINKDNYTDLLSVKDFKKKQYILWLNNADGIMQKKKIILPTDGKYRPYLFADIDNDGDEDIISRHSYQLDNKVFMKYRLLLNNGNYSFEKIDLEDSKFESDGDGYSTIKLLDIDGDSDLDLVLSDKGGRINIFEFNKNSNYTWTTKNFYLTSIKKNEQITIKWIDFDSDGDLDAFYQVNLGSRHRGEWKLIINQHH